jgi:hypothetical protein|tara:strand:- start:10816 stop:11376 length:561 start_codon:yes stop_codon:yes gene_type:complete
MLINLLSTFFFSNKFFLSISTNKNYISSAKALYIIIVATALDDIAYYIFDNKYALSNFSFIFYISEIFISIFLLSFFARIMGAGAKVSQFSTIMKSYSYSLSPVIFGSILLILISSITNLNTMYPKAVSIGALIVLMGWMWICQFIMIQTIFSRLGFIARLFLFSISVSTYYGIDVFKKYFYTSIM